MQEKLKENLKAENITRQWIHSTWEEEIKKKKREKRGRTDRINGSLG